MTSQTFKHLAQISQDVLYGPRNELVTAAACRLVAITITATEIELDQSSSVPQWRKLIDYGMKHRSSVVQEEAVAAMASISKLVDCSSVVNR